MLLNISGYCSLTHNIPSPIALHLLLPSEKLERRAEVARSADVVSPPPTLVRGHSHLSLRGGLGGGGGGSQDGESRRPGTSASGGGTPGPGGRNGSCFGSGVGAGLGRGFSSAIVILLR